MSETTNPVSSRNLRVDGYIYNQKRVGKKWTLYWCRESRKSCGATIRLHNNGHIEKRGEHNGVCTGKNCAFADITNIMLPKDIIEKTDEEEKGNSAYRITDYSVCMKRKVEDMAIKDIAERPKEIWTKISEEMDSMHPAWCGLNNRQVTDIVRNVRRKELGTDMSSKLEELSMSKVKYSKYFFLAFNLKIPNASTDKIDWIVGYANPGLYRIMRQPQVQLFIDGTFRIVPVPFYQCLVIMAHDHGNSIYVPLMYVLMSGKTEWLYRQSLQMCIQICTSKGELIFCYF